MLKRSSTCDLAVQENDVGALAARALVTANAAMRVAAARSFHIALLGAA